MATNTLSNEQRVLIHAPVGKTGRIMEAALADGDLQGVTCPDVAACCRMIDAGVGAVALLGETFADEREIAPLARHMETQPPWSDLPVVVFVADARRIPACLDRLRRKHTGRGVLILERPVTPRVFVSIMKQALANRYRQYELRDTLLKLQQVNRTLEHRVATKVEEVRKLALEQARAEQRERHRIARVLHDGLQQLLASAKMHAMLSRRTNAAAEQSAQIVDDILDEALESTRSLTVELNPPVLARGGFDDALRWLAGQFAERHGLTVDVQADALIGPRADEVRDMLFQVVRELLFNVVKHAGVREARVVLREEGELCRVEVIDAGRGFDPSELQQHVDGDGGLGLTSIPRRLRLIGGTMDIHSRPNHGTHVTLEVPV